LEELHRDPIVRPRPKVWTRGQNGRSSAKNGMPKKLGYGSIQEEVSKILRECPQDI